MLFMAKQRKGQSKRPNYAVAVASAAADITGAESVRGPVVTIRYRNLAIAAYCYIVLPILIFFVSWLRWYVGIPAAIILAFGLWSLLKGQYFCDAHTLCLPALPLVFASLALLLWLWTSGIGGYFVPSYDYPWRMAIFRDLITYRWPVIYPKTGNAFVYYLMFWLIPALFGKLFGWIAGNVALFLWSYLGLLLCLLLLFDFCGGVTISKLWIITVLFIGFSGLNIVGAAITSILGMNLYPFGLGSMEGWLDKLYNGYSFNFFYRSNNESLTEIFNQTIVLWVALPLILKNKHISTFAFIGLCVFVYAPIPFIGLLPFLCIFSVSWIIRQVKKGDIKSIVREVLSIPNLSAVVTIFPTAYLFFSCNISGTQFRMLPIEKFDRLRIVGLILFYILEFGVICLIIYPRYKKSAVFHTAIISLILIPFFELGSPGARDFCMNASIPALFILMILTIQWIFKEVVNQKISFKAVIMIAVLILSILSPVQDVESKLKTIHDMKTFPIINDSIYSFNEKQINDKEWWTKNFLCPNPETKAFYKYLARTDSKE